MKGVITRQGNLQKRSFLHLDLGRREVEPFCHDTYFLDFTALAGRTTRLGRTFLPIAQDQKKDDRQGGWQHLVLPTMRLHQQVSLPKPLRTTIQLQSSSD